MTTTSEPAPDAESGHGMCVVRDRATLLQMLDTIDDEGWNGPTGTRLLHYLRERVVRPLAISVIDRRTDHSASGRAL